MANKNSAVLEAAKNLLNEATFAKTEGCIVEGVPTTQKQLDDIIAAMKTLERNKVVQYLD